jgi:hypothetical protein
MVAVMRPPMATENTEEGRVEQFCNDAAGLVLLPESFALRKPVALTRGDQPSVTKYIEDVAKHASPSISAHVACTQPAIFADGALATAL